MRRRTNGYALRHFADLPMVLAEWLSDREAQLTRRVEVPGGERPTYTHYVLPGGRRVVVESRSGIDTRFEHEVYVPVTDLTDWQSTLEALDKYADERSEQ